MVEDYNKEYIDACYDGYLKKVQYLIENNLVTNPHIDHDGKNTEEAYRNACLKGRLNIIQYLIENNLVVNPHIDNEGNNTDQAFRWACKYGRLSVVKYLIENDLIKNPHIDRWGKNTEEAFRWACEFRYTKIAKYLFELFEFDETLLEYEEVSAKIKEKLLEYKDSLKPSFSTTTIQHPIGSQRSCDSLSHPLIDYLIDIKDYEERVDTYNLIKAKDLKGYLHLITGSDIMYDHFCG